MTLKQYKVFMYVGVLLATLIGLGVAYLITH